MRGEHPLRFQKATSPQGIIPACAGNTLDNRFGRGRTWDHPRMRGEHLTFDHWQARVMGSSPHARGTLFGGVVVVVLVGIIPACAGNTLYPCIPYPTGRDHPRMRGEHFSVVLLSIPK